MIFMDGAMGTELEKRDLPIEGAAWSASALLEHGEVIRNIHKDYIRAGAQLHIVNSFSLARHVLEPVGMGELFEQLNMKSVTLFDQAVSEMNDARSKYYAAGSLSTFAAHSNRSLLPTGEKLIQNYRDQASILFESGVDLFALEMLFDIEVTSAMISGIKDFNLPAIIGFTCDWSETENGKITTAREMGRPCLPLEQILPKVIEQIGSMDIIMGIMHSEIPVTHAALDILKKYWDGPIAIYPNSGTFTNLQLQFDSVCATEVFCNAAIKWHQEGVQIIGGCCGIGPEHITQMNAHFSDGTLLN